MVYPVCRRKAEADGEESECARPGPSPPAGPAWGPCRRRLRCPRQTAGGAGLRCAVVVARVFARAQPPSFVRFTWPRRRCHGVFLPHLSKSFGIRGEATLWPAQTMASLTPQMEDGTSAVFSLLLTRRQFAVLPCAEKKRKTEADEDDDEEEDDEEKSGGDDDEGEEEGGDDDDDEEGDEEEEDDDDDDDDDEEARGPFRFPRRTRQRPSRFARACEDIASAWAPPCMCMRGGTARKLVRPRERLARDSL